MDIYALMRSSAEASFTPKQRRRTTMSINISANLGESGDPLDHYWSTCVGAGRAQEGLRAGWLEQLSETVNHNGFRYIRFHGLYHDDMFVLRDIPPNLAIGEMGGRVYNFQYVDELFDRLLAIGIRPFVELAFCPAPLASRKASCFWWGGHGAMPNDLSAWSELVTRTVRHWQERYGHDEVRLWYFEVWNEPNLKVFFNGGYSDYLALYEATARAVKLCDPLLRVGGPATSNYVCDGRFNGEREGDSGRRVDLNEGNIDQQEWQPVWVERFLAWAGEHGVPVDFVSTHPYPTESGFIDPQGNRSNRCLSRYRHSTRDDGRRLRDIVRSSKYPKAEIHCTEWSSSPHCRDYTHDIVPAATYVIQAVLGAAGLFDSLSYWTFTDVFEEGGAGSACFHGGFGMITYQGIAKPVFHAYRFLNMLGSHALAVVDGAVVTKNMDGQMSCLAWNYPIDGAVPISYTRQQAIDLQRLGDAKRLELTVAGLRPRARVELEILAPGHGDPFGAWLSMGSPASPSRQETSRLRDASWETIRMDCCADENGCCVIKYDLPQWGLLMARECS
ncbi:MAG: beta-xylosidase [Planctomycetes bacterium]|nr:beta-xylosidase [Planctomycetota bacterium]